MLVGSISPRLLIVGLLLCLGTWGTVPAGQLATLQSLLDQTEIIRVTNAIDVAVDAKDWKLARGYFADDVRVDFTSLVGGQPAVIKSDALIDSWRTNLFAEKKTFHLRGNHLVTLEGDRATVVSHGYAWNQLSGHGSDLWECWGNYEHRLARTPRGWKVTAMTFDMTHQRGNSLVRTFLP